MSEGKTADVSEVQEGIRLPKNVSAPEAKRSVTYFQSLDAWRGLGVIWIVMAHSCIPVIGTQYPNLANDPVFAFSLYARVALSTFFVISGYCIANAAAIARTKPAPTFYFIRARVRRVFPPYLVASLITVALSVAMAVAIQFGFFRDSAIAQLDFFHHGFWYYFSNVTLTQSILGQPMIQVVYWSLCYEVVWYAIVALLLWATWRGKNAELMFDLLHVLTIGSLFWLTLLPIPCGYPLDLWPEFGFGVLVYHILSSPSRLWPKICFAVAVGLVVVYNVTYHDKNYPGIPLPPIRYLFTVGYALALMFLFRVDKIIARWRIVRAFTWVGVFSYSIYLTHLLTLGIVSQIGKKLGVTEGTFWILFVCQIVIGVLVARPFFVFFEKPFISSHRGPRVLVPVADPRPAGN